MSKDRALEAKVYTTLEDFEPWIIAGGQRPTFFPDYTDHSVRHIEEVLETSADIVRDEAWGAMTAADVAVYIMAAVLHDSALHLTKEGFEALVQPNSPWTPIPGFTNKPWAATWADFCLEAKRFDQRKLIEVFGDSLPAPTIDLENIELDARSRRLVGEFLRQHHPRLAHEIAIHGVPGPSDSPISVHLSAEIADIAGLVARSHGHSMRDMLPYLQRVYHSRTAPLGIHAVFLMVLLRIGDYLQLQNSRAPAVLQRVHRIQSPYSSTEWKIHESVRDILEDENDPETIFVRAVPPDVETHLRLHAWLTSLQRELDHSWAVLGEVFSRQSRGMRKLGIKLRRIRSNVDDSSNIADSVPYVPKHVKFTTSGPDLLGLLIGPLYGERPEIGIRELLQNSVDAVLEFRSLQARGMIPDSLDRQVIDGDVEIVLDGRDSQVTLTVTDRGTGMTPDMISEYFLRAGASFRTSNFWQNTFLDSADHAVISRSGRFGVGALAAFLLGPQIQVSTRHYSMPPTKGVTFSAGLHSDPIELYWCEMPVGTRISIAVAPDSAAKLLRQGWGGITNSDLWDWYCLEDPNVVRRIVPDGAALAQRYHVPPQGAALGPNWRRISVPGLKDTVWTYAEAPGFVCNGIIVSEESPFGDQSPHSRMYYDRKSDQLLPDQNAQPFFPPAVVVHDPDASLPLDLRRQGLARVPENFSDALLRDVYRDFLGHSLRSVPREAFFSTGDCAWDLGQGYPGYNRHPLTVSPVWCWTESGYAPYDGHCLWNLNATRIVLYPVEADTYVGTERYVGTARVSELADADRLIVVPMRIEIDYERNNWHDSSLFGDGAYTDAYEKFASRLGEPLIREMTRDARRYESPLNALVDAYDVRGVMLYCGKGAKSDLNDIVLQLEQDASDEGIKIDHTVIGDSYVTSFGRSKQRVVNIAQRLSFRPSSSYFPIIEVSVRRKIKRPDQSRFGEEWTDAFGSELIRAVGREPTPHAGPLAKYIRAQESSDLYAKTRRPPERWGD